MKQVFSSTTLIGFAFVLLVVGGPLYFNCGGNDKQPIAKPKVDPRIIAMKVDSWHHVMEDYYIADKPNWKNDSVVCFWMREPADDEDDDVSNDEMNYVLYEYNYVINKIAFVQIGYERGHVVEWSYFGKKFSKCRPESVIGRVTDTARVIYE